ncbi:MAG: aspartate--tRNA ligase [Nanoarchaeota archaeon]
MLETSFRTNTCGELNNKNINNKVKLSGFVHARRDHGGVIFIDLRDRYGITQIVFNPDKKELFKEADKLRREDVVQIEGIVKARPKGMENPSLATGSIEVFVDKLNILNKVETPPLEVEDRIEVSEDVRLKYRYLDLRRPKMQQNLLTRHKLIKVIRNYFDSLNFIDVETPILTKSTPEGARDYLVPSRVNPGKFYALPQSPQLFKQILMVAGYDRYYQIARCFRDEDLRADRQPEFTQLDIEMSFIDEDDIYKTMEGLMKKLLKELLNKDIKIPFKKMSYKEAMDKYGTDKPDLRFGLELVDVTDLCKKSDFNVFKNAELIKCLKVKFNFSRTDIDDLTKFVTTYGAKGLAYVKIEKNFEGNLSKFFSEKLQKEIIKKTNALKGDILFFIADNRKITNAAMSGLRLEIGKRLKLVKDEFNFCWVVDFPLLEFSEEENKLASVHHPFTSPKDEDVKLLSKEPEKVRAKAYDLVLNGTEIGGGSIRIHNPKLQEEVFKVLGISKEDAKKRFGFLLDALKFAVPHGGIAFGIDRLAAILTGNDSIREVIAFPKNKEAKCLMTGAPSDVDEKQLKELHLKTDFVKK